MYFAIPARVFMFVCAPGHFGVAAWIVERQGDICMSRDRSRSADVVSNPHVAMGGQDSTLGRTALVPRPV
jgi:hypothetical protein